MTYFYFLLKSPTENRYKKGKCLSKYQCKGLKTNKYFVMVIVATGKRDFWRIEIEIGNNVNYFNRFLTFICEKKITIKNRMSSWPCHNCYSASQNVIKSSSKRPQSYAIDINHPELKVSDWNVWKSKPNLIVFKLNRKHRFKLFSSV